MAASTFSKAALNNARSHKPWERAENDPRDGIETLPFNFDEPAAPAAPAAGNQLSAAPEVKHTSIAHEIAHAAAGHTPPPPGASPTDARAGNEKAVEFQTGPATAEQPASMGMTLSPQADAPAIVAPAAPAADGPTESIGEDNLEDLLDHLNVWPAGWDTQWEPGSTLRIGFPQSFDDIPDFFRTWDGLVDAEDAADKGLTFFSQTQQEAVMRAVETWSDVADIQFTPVGPGEEADIYYYALALDSPADANSSGIIPSEGSRILFNTAGNVWPDMEEGTSGFHAVIHETGHSLGLSHPGDYDAYDAETPTYEDDAEYIEDTMMYSVMSYFDGDNTGYSGDGEGDGVAMLATPRSHDIYVMHELYGVNWDAHSGNTTYGYNASAGLAAQYDFTNFDGEDEHEVPQITIWDGRGVDDWLDLSGDDSGVTLDLRPGAFSSTHGMTYNLSLAYVPDDAPDEYAGYIENAAGGDGDDSITGNDRDNELVGNDGEDHLYGRDGDDELNGGEGNDWMSGGFGLDTFYGGAGLDTVDFTYSDADWTIDLANLLDYPNDLGILGTASSGGDDEELHDVENVTTGSGDDHISGSSQDNHLSSGGGNDTLIGRDGDDRLYAGDGNDTLEGGDHSDRLYGEAGNDTLHGGTFTDYLYGGDGIDTLNGGADGDYLWGQDGNDTLDGGDGTDHIDGGEGDDTISGGGGDDELDGGDGNDTVDYTASSADWEVSLTFETAESASGTVEDVRDFEGVRMGSGNDTVRGTTGENALFGGAGRDELFGLAADDWLEGQNGDDLLNGGAGGDVIIGGGGIDIASYADDTAGVRVDLNIVGFQDTVGSGTDLLEDIEGLTGSTHSDWLFGSSVANQLSGGFGEDQMFGREGNDTLTGGDGNDNLFGGLGNDVLNGGNGIDWANYSLETAFVRINLATQNQQNTAGAGLDTLTSIENVIGTGFNDLLIGNDVANRLEGGSGNDIITGNDGADDLFGGNGNDSLNGGTGNDTLEGGAGIDWALYNTGLASGVTIDLFAGSQNTGGGGIDTLHDIENVYGTLFGDSLTGNNVANELRGEGGDDWIWGNGGNDVVNGGSGDDAVAGGSGADDVIGGFGNDHLWGGSSSDDFIFDDSWGDDWIWDFQPGSDRIDLSAVANLTSLNQLDVENTDNGALYTYNGQSILLVGVSSLSVHTTDFIL